MRSLNGSSLKYPRPRLQLVQRRPLTLFSLWQWSTCKWVYLPPGSLELQIAHSPFCKEKILEYSSSVIPYLDLSFPSLAPPERRNFLPAAAIFSGFFSAQVNAGFALQTSQAVAKIVRLFFFKLKAEAGSFCLQTRHFFMGPFYV